jgi:hypothetical protein
MKQQLLGDLTAKELLERFITLGVEQAKAENDDDMPSVKRLFWLIDEVVAEFEEPARRSTQRTDVTVRLSKHERALKGGKSNAGSCPTGRATGHRSNSGLDIAASVLRCAHVFAHARRGSFQAELVALVYFGVLSR